SSCCRAWASVTCIPTTPGASSSGAAGACGSMRRRRGPRGATGRGGGGRRAAGAPPAPAAGSPPAPPPAPRPPPPPPRPPPRPPALRARAPLAALGRLEPSPIVSTHLWFDRPVLRGDFVGLLGTTTQWAFNRSRLLGESGDGQCVSAVISAGRAVVGWDSERITGVVLADLHALLPAARDAVLRPDVVVKAEHA